jgi:hypothetical protein
MADDETTDDAEELIQQLLDAGYSYDGRVPEENEDDDSEVDEPAGEEDESEDEDGGGEEASPTPPPAPGLPDEELAQLLKLRELLTDPDIASGVHDLLEAKFNPPKKEITKETVDLPEWIDPDDEQAVNTYLEIQKLQQHQDEKVGELAGQLEREEADRNSQRVASDIAAAVEQFKAAHPDLTDDEIDKIRRTTAELGIVPAVMANTPDGPVAGLVKAMEIGSMSDESVRGKVLGIATSGDTEKKERRRKSHLNALSGSSGSTPRTKTSTTKPMNWNEVTSRIVEELNASGGVS